MRLHTIWESDTILIKSMVEMVQKVVANLVKMTKILWAMEIKANHNNGQLAVEKILLPITWWLPKVVMIGVWTVSNYLVSILKLFIIELIKCRTIQQRRHLWRNVRQFKAFRRNLRVRSYRANRRKLQHNSLIRKLLVRHQHLHKWHNWATHAERHLRISKVA